MQPFSRTTITLSLQYVMFYEVYTIVIIAPKLNRKTEMHVYTTNALYSPSTATVMGGRCGTNEV